MGGGATSQKKHGAASKKKGEGLTVVFREEIHRTGGAPMAIYLHQVPAGRMSSGSLGLGGPAGVKL